MSIDIFPGSIGAGVYEKYANRVFNIGAVGANQIRNLSGGKLEQSVWVSILFEYSFYFIAMTREMGLLDAPAMKRTRIIEELGSTFVPAAVDFIFDAEDGNSALKTRYSQLLAARIHEYEKFDAIMPKDELDDFESTAAGALSRLIAQLAGEPDDVVHAVACQSHVVDSRRALDMEIFVMMAD